MGRRTDKSRYTIGYPHLRYCSWAHGGASASEVHSASRVRPETVLIPKRQKEIDQFLKEVSLQDAPAGFCEFCRTIDFLGIFNLDAASIPDHGLPAVVLDHLRPDMVGSRCQCCSMLSSMAFEVPGLKFADRKSDREQWHLRVFPITCLRGVRTTPEQIVSLFLCLVREVDTERYPFPQFGSVGVPEVLNHDLLGASWSRGLILPSRTPMSDRTEHGVVCHAAYLDGNIDYLRVKDLLDDCSNCHLECSNYSLGSFPIGARVIDCQTREIVKLQQSMPYLALSYVWGTPPTNKAAQELFVKNQTIYLNDPAPQTIEDALTVTRQLGYKHIWIDRYCIQQHNNTEKKDQIRQMASIYSYAAATICATGEYSSSGLYGVSRRRRPQQRVEKENLVMIRCLWPENHLRQHLKYSKWPTRGWTYQEPLLSKNCLFFTPETVVQVCHTRTFGVALVVEYNSSSCFTNRTVVLSSSLFMPHLPLCMSASLSRNQLAFTQSVQQYQKRNFSFDSDALDAFMGFLSLVDMKSYWGVPVLRIEKAYYAKDAKPVQSDTSIGFIFGLLWITQARQEDRWNAKDHHTASEDFPSWSWLSRRAVLTDFLHHGGVLRAARIRAIQLTYQTELVLHTARIQLEDQSGQHKHPNDMFLPVSRFVPEHSKYMSITGVTAKWKLSAIKFGRRTGGILKSPQFPSVVLDEVSDPTIQPYLVQMKLAGPARIAFDQGYTVDSRTDLTQHTGAPAQNGLAVLMLISGWTGKKLVGSYTYWLAVRQGSDGTYRREGMIECHLHQDVGYTAKYRPPEETLLTIRLG